MSNAIRVPSSSSLNNLSLLAGGAYGGAASAFTETAYHGQLVCCGCGHVIKIMSIKTGQVLHTLRGHTETVTGLAVSPRHALQLFSSSRDGTVIVWNISNGTKVDTHHLVNGAPILDISLPASPSSTSDSDIIYVVAEVRAGGGGKLDKSTRKAYSYNIKTKKVERMVMKGLKGGGSMEVAFRQISRGNMEGVTTHTKKKSKVGGVVLEPGVTVVAGITKKTLKIWNSTTSKARKFIHTNKLTSIALHPTAPHAATGDECGRIQLWYNVARPSSSGNTTTTTTLHWHSHRLHALCFTPDGHYLLSGGEESVLVIWQLRTLKKQFLPRLGSTIVAISVAPDGMHYIVGTDDNTVHVIDSSTLQTSWKLTGIGCAVSPTTTQYSNFKPSQYLYTGMAIDPRTRCFMLNSTLGSGRLQLYDYHRDRHVQVNISLLLLLFSFSSFHI
jgi:NET1-associated nuclear protein 1 (U3 small nucleolar RNA-associated protein 17)